MNRINALEEDCRRAFVRAGIDGRTSYFASCLKTSERFRQFQSSMKFDSAQTERLLDGFLSDRFADYFERRVNGLETDCSIMNFIMSQGYKRGMTWRGIPLGKTCWDVSIYQQLLQELRPRTVIEFGTGPGASALFFLDHCRMFGVDTQVISLDANPRDINPALQIESKIELVAGDAKDLKRLLPSERLRDLPHPWLVVDDCHAHLGIMLEHVLPFMKVGDYFVIEDIGMNPRRWEEISTVLRSVPKGSLSVDTSYTDMFGRNLTSSPDSIFRKMC